MEKKYYNINEIADYLGFTVSAIRKWVRTGQIPHTRFNGGIRFDLSEIEKWASKNQTNIYV